MSQDSISRICDRPPTATRPNSPALTSPDPLIALVYLCCARIIIELPR